MPKFIIATSRVPVEGKSSVCLICMKYRIIFLISLSAWVKYYYRILQTHHARTHVHTHARTHAHTHARTHE